MNNLFIFSILIAPALVWGYCDTYALQHCVDNTAFEKYKNSKSQQLFVSHSEEELTKLCHDFDSVSACWTRNSQGCEKVERRLFEGIQDAFHYMCGDGLQKFLRNQQCLGTDSLKSNAQKCEKTLNDQVAEFKSEAQYKDRNELKEEACGYIDEAKKCINDYVRDACGKEAADFEDTFMNKMIAPLVAVVSCGGLSRMSVILIAGGCSVGFFLLVTCLIVIIRNKRGHAGRVLTLESGHTNPLTSAPPPYKQFQ